MSRVYKIDDPFIISQTNLVRSKNTKSLDLKRILEKIGEDISKKIIEEFYLEEIEIVTPLNYKIKSILPRLPLSIIITTKDDMLHFGTGIKSTFSNSVSGYMDFEGRRGLEALDCSVRELILPEIKYEKLEALIIAKSVLATGCTAISLTKSALPHCFPDKLIIIAIFYSTRGLEDLKKEFPNAHIFIVGEPDDRNEDGLLVPSIGLLEERLKKS